MSEKALEMLSKIDFEDGLRKNIPPGIQVANKFGEYSSIKSGEMRQYQLHDCGIIYHPRYSYLLCIMTKGDSLDNLKQTIQETAKTTYTIVNNFE